MKKRDFDIFQQFSSFLITSGNNSIQHFELFKEDKISKAAILPGEPCLDLVIPLLSTVLTEEQLIEKICLKPKEILGYEKYDSSSNWVEIEKHHDPEKVRIMKTAIVDEIVYDRNSGTIKLPRENLDEHTKLIREKALDFK